jgi:hypothetical protein
MIRDETRTFLEKINRSKNYTQQLITESLDKLAQAEKLIQLSHKALSQSAAQLKELRQAGDRSSP